MQKSKLLVAVLGTLMAMPALAEDSPFSGNVSLTNNYVFRGLSQTGNKPALQGGFDYAHSSGFYAGVWGSNISWLSDANMASNASIELDTYLGFSNSFAEDFTYDVGFLRYNYPGTYAAGQISANTNEVYGSLGYKWVTLKYSRSTSDLFGVANSSGSGYLELGAEYTFDGPGVTVGAHYGKQKVKNNAGSDYKDYSLSVSKDFAGYTFGLMYTKASTNAPVIDNQGNDLGKGHAVLSVSRSF